MVRTCRPDASFRDRGGYPKPSAINSGDGNELWKRGRALLLKIGKRARARWTSKVVARPQLISGTDIEAGNYYTAQRLIAPGKR